MTDTPFTTFPFRSTSGDTARTMPDRLDDVINVKDFGATGNGSTNDRVAIQAALDYAFTNSVGVVSPTRGAVYFPPGTYLIDAALNLESIQGQGRIYGAGTASSIIGDFAGFLLDNDANNSNLVGGSIEFLTLKNSSTAANSGCIRYSSGYGALISHCNIKGHIGVQLGKRDDLDYMFDSCIEHCNFLSHGAYPSWDTGSIGILLGAENCVFNCSLQGWDVAVAVAGAECGIYNTRMESNNIGLKLGYGGVVVDGGGYYNSSMESNTIGIYAYGVTAFSLKNIVITATAVEGVHAPESGLAFPPGGVQMMTVDGVHTSGDFSVAGLDITGDFSVSSPAVTFISCSFSSVHIGAGVDHLLSCEQYNCTGIGPLWGNIAKLPTYVTTGARRYVLDNDNPATAANWGTTIVNSGSGSNAVPCWLNHAGVWKLG